MQSKHRFDMKLNSDDSNLLLENATKCCMSKSAYVRSLIRGYVPREAPSYDFHRVLSELVQIGNNMNQVAYIANLTNIVDSEKYAATAKLLFAKVAELESVVCGLDYILDSEEHGDS